jgi:hypothetical protein
MEDQMSTETFVNYWIGEEPTPPSPTLDKMPAYVDVVPLAFLHINPDYSLYFDFLCKTHSPEAIKAAIKVVRANGTKVLFSILDQRLGTVPDIPAFVRTVVDAVVEWGVDGIDFDFEPPYESETLIKLVSALRPALRAALGREPLLTAPIYSPWLSFPDFLKEFTAELDFVTTMDYNLAQGSIESCEEYVRLLPPEKVAIGIICMGPSPPSPGSNNSLAEAVQMARWKPAGARKRGAMLYTFSYDVKARPKGGTGEPDGAYTKAIHENLP